MNLQERLEKYASTPDERGSYPTDADCDAFEREQKEKEKTLLPVVKC